MSRRMRTILVIAGLLLVGLSIVALAYALVPADVVRESTPLAPTLFTLPAGGLP